MSDAPRRSIKDSVEGTSIGDFRAMDWLQLIVTSGLVGSAFLGIALALRSVEPGTIAFARAVLGAGALAVLPGARRSIARIDWPRLVVAAMFGIAAPMLLFALAEERIPSALAGMLISAIPVFVAALAAGVTRSWPTPRRLAGLVVGFGGIALLAAPNLGGSGTEIVGVVMVLVAVLTTALASTLFAPLAQTYGSLPVTMWILAVSALALSPLGVIGLPGSSFEWLPVGSLLVLGVLGTGANWALWIGLVARVGAVRASTAGYIIPIVALALGVTVLDEHLETVQVAGVVLALLGGYLLSRGEQRET